MRVTKPRAIGARARQSVERIFPPVRLQPWRIALPPPKEPQRIAKLLARAGVASRREIERMIEEGRIAIDGKPLETPATLLTSLRGVTVDGNPVQAAAPARLFRFHKPAGVLTAERDFSGRPTIYDRLPRDLPRVIPVGRLDLNTEGLLLLTTDGELKRQLELPSSQVERTYRARAFGDVSQEQLEELIHGVEIEGVRYGSIDANMERRTGRNVWIEMRLTEGKNREVRRVLEFLGLQVSRLIRVAYGPFVLGDLPAGAVDEVRQHDLVEFRRGAKSPLRIGDGGGRGAPPKLHRAPNSSPGFPGEGDRAGRGGGARAERARAPDGPSTADASHRRPPSPPRGGEEPRRTARTAPPKPRREKVDEEIRNPARRSRAAKHREETGRESATAGRQDAPRKRSDAPAGRSRPEGGKARRPSSGRRPSPGGPRGGGRKK